VATEEPIRIPITGELDLHTFAPQETSRVLEAYLQACIEKGVFSVRIVHGKGTGTLRETVHAFLRRSPLVAEFHSGNETSGGWGATHAALRKPQKTKQDQPEAAGYGQQSR
jgi:DNA-nicking Smr family endonuclease